MPLRLVPARMLPSTFSTSAGTISGRSLRSASGTGMGSGGTYLALVSPLLVTIASVASTPFSCAMAFASRHHFLLAVSSGAPCTYRRAGSEMYVRKNGSLSEAVLADAAMTSLYALRRAFQFCRQLWWGSFSPCAYSARRGESGKSPPPGAGHPPWCVTRALGGAEVVGYAGPCGWWNMSRPLRRCGFEQQGSDVGMQRN